MAINKLVLIFFLVLFVKEDNPSSDFYIVENILKVGVPKRLPIGI